MQKCTALEFREKSKSEKPKILNIKTQMHPFTEFKPSNSNGNGIYAR